MFHIFTVPRYIPTANGQALVGHIDCRAQIIKAPEGGWTVNRLEVYDYSSIDKDMDKIPLADHNWKALDRKSWEYAIALGQLMLTQREAINSKWSKLYSVHQL